MAAATRFIALLGLAAVAAGCADDPVGPGPAAAPDPAHDAAGLAATPDLSGEWSFARVVKLSLPDWAAREIFGIEPEGPMTHLRCESGGTLEILQDGDGFHGTAYIDGTECETGGGYHFSRPAGMATLTDGNIVGRSLDYIWDGDGPGPVFCPTHGVVAGASDGTATSMAGSGRCIVPGHPSSPAPVDPPPGGTSKVLHWEAWRS
jgi:hypothetical protein